MQAEGQLVNPFRGAELHLGLKGIDRLSAPTFFVGVGTQIGYLAGYAGSLASALYC